MYTLSVLPGDMLRLIAKADLGAAAVMTNLSRRISGYAVPIVKAAYYTRDISRFEIRRYLSRRLVERKKGTYILYSHIFLASPTGLQSTLESLEDKVAHYYRVSSVDLTSIRIDHCTIHLSLPDGETARCCDTQSTLEFSTADSILERILQDLNSLKGTPMPCVNSMCDILTARHSKDPSYASTYMRNHLLCLISDTSPILIDILVQNIRVTRRNERITTYRLPTGLNRRELARDIIVGQRREEVDILSGPGAMSRVIRLVTLAIWRGKDIQIPKEDVIWILEDEQTWNYVCYSIEDLDKWLSSTSI